MRKVPTMRRIPGVFLALLLSTVAVRAREAPPTRLPLAAPVEARSTWYGIYVLGRKAGWAHEEARRVGAGTAGLYVVTMRMRFQLEAEGRRSRMEYGMILAFDAQPPYALRSGSNLEQGPDGMRTVRLEVGPEGATATVTESGETRTHAPDAVDYTLEDYLTPETWIRGRPVVGDVLRVRDYDVEDLEADVKTYTVAAREETGEPGAGAPGYELRLASDREGEQGVVHTDRDGRMVSMSMGSLLELRRETREEAQRIEEGTDLFRMGQARVAGRIGDATHVRELVLEVHGEGAAALTDGPRQSVDRDTEPGVVLLRLGKAHGRRSTATPAEIEEALRETVKLPIHHPEVVALAKEAVGDARTDAERVARLVTYVAKHVKDEGGPGTPTVLDLVRDGRGDCTEHALLLTALARAVGIPAREVSGLMYMGDGAQAFGGHAWNEVVIDGEWVQVDPTWNETDVDATHITLSRTERDRAVQYRAYGGLRFVVREVVAE